MSRLLLRAAPLLLTAALVQAQDQIPRASAAAAAASVPAGMTREQSCSAQWRAYDRSGACYARYRTRHGIRPEAAERCGPPVKDPSVECPRR